MSEVRTRDEAIVQVAGALQTWSTTLAGALSQAEATVRAASDEAARTVQERSDAAAALEALLASSAPDRRQDVRTRLVVARAALDEARRAQRDIQDIAARVIRLYRTHTTATTSAVGQARAKLSAMGVALEAYRSGSSSSGGPQSDVSAATAAAVSGGTGLADIDVSAADLQENPVLDDNTSRGTFGKGGLSRADYRWLVQTWTDVVGPGVASGRTRDDFVARDERSGARELRRTADVYDLFLGSERIRVNRLADGSCSITNGRHRLLIARELGIKTLPGEVS